MHTGDSPKWVKSRRWKRKKERRAKVGDNNGQAMHGARKPPGPIRMAHAWRTQVAWTNLMKQTENKKWKVNII